MHLFFYFFQKAPAPPLAYRVSLHLGSRLWASNTTKTQNLDRFFRFLSCLIFDVVVGMRTIKWTLWSDWAKKGYLNRSRSIWLPTVIQWGAGTLWYQALWVEALLVCQKDLWNHTQVFISLSEYTWRGLEEEICKQSKRVTRRILLYFYWATLFFFTKKCRIVLFFCTQSILLKYCLQICGLVSTSPFEKIIHQNLNFSVVSGLELGSFKIEYAAARSSYLDRTSFSSMTSQFKGKCLTFHDMLNWKQHFLQMELQEFSHIFYSLFKIIFVMESLVTSN